MQKVKSIKSQLNSEAQAENLTRLNHIDGLSKNTQQAIKSDSTVFFSSVNKASFLALDYSEQALGVDAFLKAQIESGKKLATVKRYKASMAAWFDLNAADAPNPFRSTLVNSTIKALAANNTAQQKQAVALRWCAIQKALPLFDRRNRRDALDKAVLLTAYDTMARVSELAAIELEAVAFYKNGTGTLDVYVGKTRKHETRYLSLEAVKALRQWVKVAGIAEGKLFRAVNKNHSVADKITTKSLSASLARSGTLAGLEGVSGHSCRVGMAQDLTEAGISLTQIMQAGGWTSPRMPAHYSRKIEASRSGAAQLRQQQASTPNELDNIDWIDG